MQLWYHQRSLFTGEEVKKSTVEDSSARVKKKNKIKICRPLKEAFKTLKRPGQIQKEITPVLG